MVTNQEVDFIRAAVLVDALIKPRAPELARLLNSLLVKQAKEALPNSNVSIHIDEST